MKIIVTSLLLFSTAINSSTACGDTPAEQVVPAEELIARTTDIALAKVIKAEVTDDGVLYSFKNLKILKGSPDDEFTITGFSMVSGSDLTTFGHHTLKDFWEQGGGRSTHDIDCEIHPSFAVGGIYLIFLGEPYHQKGFEQIIRTNGDEKVRDKWLSWVESKIEEQNKAEMATPRKPSD